MSDLLHLSCPLCCRPTLTVRVSGQGWLFAVEKRRQSCRCDVQAVWGQICAQAQAVIRKREEVTP